MATVFIETTIPSAYVSARSDPGSVYRREITRKWWSNQLTLYQTYTSDPVILELEQGVWPNQVDALELMRDVPKLAVDDEALAIAARYIAERLVPDGLTGDATHLATACVHKMDFLLTGNIRHLANPNKLDHLTVINRRLGLLTPAIVTPETLWLENDE